MTRAKQCFLNGTMPHLETEIFHWTNIVSTITLTCLLSQRMDMFCRWMMSAILFEHHAGSLTSCRFYVHMSKLQHLSVEQHATDGISVISRSAATLKDVFKKFLHVTMYLLMNQGRSEFLINLDTLLNMNVLNSYDIV